MFLDSPNEQQLNNSLATVATLLLQIGEAGRKLKVKLSTNQSVDFSSNQSFDILTNKTDSFEFSTNHNQASNEDYVNDVFPSDQSSNDLSDFAAAIGQNVAIESLVSQYNNKNNSSNGNTNDNNAEPEWIITFEQFVANMLTEPAIVTYFERQLDVIRVISNYQSQRFKRQISSTPSTPAI